MINIIIIKLLSVIYSKFIHDKTKSKIVSKFPRKLI